MASATGARQACTLADTTADTVELRSGAAGTSLLQSDARDSEMLAQPPSEPFAEWTRRDARRRLSVAIAAREQFARQVLDLDFQGVPRVLQGLRRVRHATPRLAPRNDDRSLAAPQCGHSLPTQRVQKRRLHAQVWLGWMLGLASGDVSSAVCCPSHSSRC